jgi:hypothetical protein
MWTQFVAQIYHMFRPDGAIFMYTGILQSPVSLTATLPTLASVYILGVRCMYGFYMPCVAKCTAYWISKIPEDGPIRPKHVMKGNVWYICATNCVDGNCNKARVSGYRTRGPGFDSRCFQIFWEAVGLERGPLSLVSTREYNWEATWKK